MAEQKSILDAYPEYRLDIGIEVHVQLNTKSKIFCSSSNDQTETANSHICQICTGYPGTLPVLNKKVVESAIKAALATNSKIAPKSTFARKHYFYPDLPKDYQITQDKKPYCSEGKITITKENGTEKDIRLIRIHMEEDAGKNIHAQGDESFVDFNRAGTPLLEIVSYPDIESVEEVRAYLKKVRSLVQYLGISTGNMEEGSFRADTNISVRKKDAKELGTRCELKNINSFKFISDAVDYEVERQIELLENGEKVLQQTRLWDTKKRVSRPMRSKEEAADYRFFQDPDLPLIEINEEWISRVKASLPELPDAKSKRLREQYDINAYQAGILVDDRELALYFEDSAKHTKNKQLIHWVLRDVIGFLKEQKLHISNFKMSPNKLAEIMNLLQDGAINNRAAQEVFEVVAQNGISPSQVVKDKGLEQIGDSAELEKIVKEIVDANPDSVAKYKSGKDKLFGFFVGQAMKKTKGKGNPKIINEFVKKYLA
jgi:aspartyl-tRNA(Asn)/glutamyl-tRNA(Gln) amidotransferase subunit B